MQTLECDLLVIGSGAAGLCAAATAASKGLKVIVTERADVLGGTTAWSGGWMWLPRNALARDAGITETADRPRAYLEAVLDHRFNAERVDAFLDSAPAMVNFLIERGFQFEAGNRICDIYGNMPGAGTGGRSLIAAPFNARQLGKKINLLRETKRETSFIGMPIQAGADLAAFLNVTRKPGAFWHVAKRLVRHIGDLTIHGRALDLRNGAALVARLFEIADRFGVRWLTSCEAIRLTERKGVVCGAELASMAGSISVSARRGVVLATGGFSQNQRLRSEHFPQAEDHLSLAVPEADGSGLRLAVEMGGVLDSDMASAGAWCPVSAVRWPDGTRGVFPHIIERAKPGVIAVRANGRRFVNEADGYHDYVTALMAATPDGEAARSWLICDRRFIRRWGLGIVRPAPLPLRYWLKSGYLISAPTLAALADACGIDRQLADTVARFNRDTRIGQDTEFGRGKTPYNRHQGDPEHCPNPNLASIETGPFYAVEVRPGSFGSFAGLRTDEWARVLRTDGSPVAGLFAAGADMASIMGGHYPAGGINLGPAMVFGYRAGLFLSKNLSTTQRDG